MNQEAWKVLKCHGDRNGREDYENVTCEDADTGKSISVLGQFSKYLKLIDSRLSEIHEPDFMQTIVRVASDEAKLI
jgi:hypothetical protein